MTTNIKSPAERNTNQRRAIRDAIKTADRPLSPQEILTAARPVVPSLGIATVYRTLKTLVSNGWLSVVDLPGEPPRYEVHGKGHHHHFRCKTCGRVFEIHGCDHNLAQLTPEGFHLTGHELFLFGHCRECVARTPALATLGN
jgi:Fur family ferric uptake transcriptional regulator